MVMKRSGLFAILLAAVLVTGCGSSGSTASYDMSPAESMNGRASTASAIGGMEYTTDAAADYADGAEYEIDPEYGVETSTDAGAAGSTDSDSKGIAEVDTGKKVIRNMSIRAETTDLNALDQAIQARVSELGGYIESSSIDGSAIYDDGYYLGEDGNTYYDTSYAAQSGNMRSYRYAYYTIRIPAQHLDQFAEAIEDGANVLSHSTTTQDITSSYVDTDSRRKSLEEEQQVLNDMMQRAETVDEMIQIESQLSDVRYELENIRSQLKSMQDRVSYSTVNLDITEVKVLTDTTARDLTWQERISNGFESSCERLVVTSQEIVIWIASNAPMIVFYIILAIILLVILRLVLVVIGVILGSRHNKAARGNKKNKKAMKAPANPGAESNAPAADAETNSPVITETTNTDDSGHSNTSI